jgi:hypothetical protein
MVANEAPKTPKYAATDPPPGAGDSLAVSFAKSSKELNTNFL